MKNLLLLGFVLMLVSTVAAQPSKSIEVRSSIESVTVYPRGAEINRKAAKFLSSGRYFVKFVGLESDMQPNSIGVSATGDVKILSISSQSGEVKEAHKPKRMLEVEDSLETFEFDLQFNKNMADVYARERDMILANQSIGWDNTAFAIEDLEDLSDFYRDRLADIMLKSMELQEKGEDMQKVIRRLRSSLGEFQTKMRQSSGEILVEVQTSGNVSASFDIKYIVGNAGWMPTYNVKVEDIDKPLNVSYNAKVFQNTGTDWGEAKLTLTNADPTKSGQKPYIEPWRLQFMDPVTAQNQALRFSNTYESAGAPAQLAKMQSDEIAQELSQVHQAVIRFEINTRHNIPSNGKVQVISIDEFSMPADYKYYAAPKQECEAFLLAYVSGFESYDLLAGEVNLFLGNTFVGKSFINPSTVKDKLEFSLGRDPSIIVRREKIKDYNSVKTFGSSQKQQIGIEISVKNTKNIPIELTLEDQVPVSSDKDIEVDIEETSDAALETETGILKWVKKIQPNNAAKVQFKYSVKHPTGRSINF